MSTIETCPKCGKTHCTDASHRPIAATPPPTLDGVAELVRLLIGKDVDAAKARGAAIIDAAQQYARASEANAVGVFMQRNGLAQSAPQDHLDAALHLLDLVNALPEVVTKRDTIVTPAAIVTAPVTIDPASVPVGTVIEVQPAARPADPPTIKVNGTISLPDRQPAAPRLESPPTASPTMLSAKYASLRRVLSARKPAVIFGGDLRQEKLRWLRGILTFAEWQTVREGEARRTQAFCERVKNGNVGLVFVMEQVLSHAPSNLLVAAARDAGVPFAYVGTAGQAQLERALDELQARLAGSQ